MAFVAAALGGDPWRNNIRNVMQALIDASGGGLGLPRQYRTRAIPLHLGALLVELQAGAWATEAEGRSPLLIDTIDGVPIYPCTSTDANDLDFEYPAGTWTDAVVSQE